MYAEQVAWITGQRSPNCTGDTAHVYGTDLGICWDDGRGGVLVAFGDTFGRDPRFSDYRERARHTRRLPHEIVAEVVEDVTRGSSG